jgi:adenosylmethionine-8-amino-7-oxononanoate aminotransferase
MTRFWHPVADMQAVSERGELLIERGEGVWIWDEQGRQYLDSTASLWYCNVGYGRQEIVDAVAAQMAKLPAYSGYGDLSTRPTTELAERIAAIAPMADARVFFTSGGAESIETAAKLARRYWSLQGESSRTVVISRERAYHGMAAYGTSLAGTDAFKTGLGTLVGDTLQIPWNSADALADTIGRIGAERVAAFFCEPVIGAGGALAPPPGYLEAVRAICRDAGVLFVADEVICGYGRVGAWFASSRFGLDPDLVTFAKGITSGYVPLGGVIVGARVSEPFWSGGAGMWRHGYTYSGHAAATAAAHPNLDIIEREGLCDRALELEVELTEALAPLASHPLVSEVRSGVGVIGAVQPDPERIAADPSLPDRISFAARDHGVMARTLVGGALQISPSLVITRAELDELASRLGAAFDAVEAELTVTAS